MPKGILKTNWMHKHLHLIPSLVVIFFELDWNDPAFKDKQIELKEKIDMVRYVHTIARVKRTCLAAFFRAELISMDVELRYRWCYSRARTAFPRVSATTSRYGPNAVCLSVDDVYSSERDQMANTLCTYFDIPKRSLCVLPVLPQPDNLSAWIDRCVTRRSCLRRTACLFRLEQTFIESSQNYYMNEIRGVKKHKETLNNITHQLLHIRHQFKVGFFSELKQDIPSAVKSYRNAYSYLTDNARMHDTNILEMKIVAGFLTYKVRDDRTLPSAISSTVQICRISFELSQPVEAINHFRRHADIFKGRVGPIDLAFEHKAWLSKQ